jgi:hypothetical protein
MAIGETGTLSENTTYSGEALQVTFTEPLSDPVVALTATNYGGNKFSLRVIEFQTDANGDATGFTFTIDEWENHDGAHPAVEDINWIAIESGTHVLPDGRLIEAGYANADSDGEDVTLSHDFPDTPVVLTTVASDNHASHVDSAPTAINSGGFTLSVEEAERMDGIHGMEKVGWIAVQVGRRRQRRDGVEHPERNGSGWETLVPRRQFRRNPSSWPKPRRRTSRHRQRHLPQPRHGTGRSCASRRTPPPTAKPPMCPRPWRSSPSRPG